MTRYYCRQPQRRLLAALHDTFNGIDYLEVLDRQAEILGGERQRMLLVRCLKPLPADAAAANVRITGGVRVYPIPILWAARADTAPALEAAGRINADERDWLLEQTPLDTLLVVRTDSTGDYSTYRLCLVRDDAPLDDFDPPLSCVDFSFKVECPSDFDCAPDQVCPPEEVGAPPIDYLARDYSSLRRLLLDRLSAVLPEWRDRLAAEQMVSLVEVLAHAGDHLSYYQDAVATEAYLGTARRRPSVRRHARLLDYAMHDGCNARAWVLLRAETGVDGSLLEPEYAEGQYTCLLTRMPGEGTVIDPDDLEQLLSRYRPQVFEPLHGLRLYAAHNDIPFHTWGDEQCCLPRGATAATLEDDESARLLLRPGDVLVFEEIRGAATGAEADADPTHRYAVRLTRVVPEAQVDGDGNRSPGPLQSDALLEQPVVEIEWAVEDALPFPLCLSARIAEGDALIDYPQMALAHGNALLVDHGRRVSGHADLVPTGERTYRPGLEDTGITQCEPFDPAAWQASSAAGTVLLQDPRRALPAVRLTDTEQLDWSPVRDLLGSDRFDTHFVVETEEDGRAALRFGDGVYGRRPEAGVPLAVDYRVGSGPAGNVGTGAIAHIVTAPGLGIDTTESALERERGVRNPLPAAGGQAPEDLEEVRQYAPCAFRRQERAVTEADYAAMAERHPQVSRAVARRRWTGSWHTIFVTVDRLGGLPVDDDFEAELAGFLAQFQLAGHDIEIEPPRFVPLDIALRICVRDGHRRSDVRQALRETFSNADLADGSRGYFHPDNFTFGQPVYLSRVMAAAMAVPGVRWVDMNPAADPPARFRRWGRQPAGEIDAGLIEIGRFEIARLDNDPNAQEQGLMEFHLEGGL